MKNIYADFMAFEINTHQKLLRTKWVQSISSTEYRKGMSFVLDTIRTQNLELWLYDASRSSGPEISDQIWMAEVFTPLINKTKIQRVAAVVSQDLIQQTVIDKIHTRSQAYKRADVSFETFYDLASAEEWLLAGN